MNSRSMPIGFGFFVFFLALVVLLFIYWRPDWGGEVSWGGLWPPLPSELKRLLTNLRNLMNTHNTTDPPVAPGIQRIPRFRLQARLRQES